MVRFDFRPQTLVNPPRPKTRKLFLLMFLLLMLFLSSAGYAGFMVFKDYLPLNSEVISLNNKADSFETAKINLTAEVGRLAKQEAAYQSGLQIMISELPSIEVLNAIDQSLPPGVTLDGIKMDGTSVALSGTANSEENIVLATRSLLTSGVFSTAQVPVANRVAADRGGIKFTLALTPLPLGEVKPR